MHKHNKSVVVIGAGIGGLATAALLGKDGYNVTVLEKNDQIGGRARQWKSKGFTFDMGPSWYMMPKVFEDYFARFGKKVDDFYTLKQLNTHYSVWFEGNRRYDIVKEYQKNRELFEKVEKGAGQNLDNYLKTASYLYDTAMSGLVMLDHQSTLQLLNPSVLKAFPRMKLFTSFHNFVKKHFKNKDLQKILEFTTVFLGGSPYNTPAFYSLISHTDFRLGIYHPLGGMGKIIDALESLCKNYRVEIITNQEVKTIAINKNTATNVKTQNKSYPCDIVICNADYHFAETMLMSTDSQTHKENYWKKKTLAPSAFLIYLGIQGNLQKATHHMLYFSNSWEEHFKDVYARPDWPKNPSYYVHVPSKTDSTLSPKNCETVIILVPVAPDLADLENLREEFFQKTISHFENLIGEKITKKIITKRIFSHRDFINDYNAYKGTAFGLAHTLMQTAMFRPKNKSKKVDNLYYVGQYTNPGVGVPICLLSSQIVFNIIQRSELSE